jgi:hypothetical protein
MWGSVELEPEVADWYLALDEEAQARVAFHVNRLADLGPLLDEPYTKQLSGKLRELRFFLNGYPTRITYWIAPGRIVVLMTLFRKTRPNERQEIERAKRAFQRCRSEHQSSGDDDE